VVQISFVHEDNLNLIFATRVWLLEKYFQHNVNRYLLQQYS